MSQILSFKTEKERENWRRRRRLILSKIPECLNKKIVKVSFCYRREEFEEAFRLLYERYLQVGLLKPLPEEIYFTPYQALPESRICIARDLKSKQVTSTATLVLDSELGLPSDPIYKDYLDKLRKEGRKLAEFSCLAARPDIYSRNGLFYIFRLLYKYAAAKRVTDIVISVHPKHTEFYELILQFERLGPLRYYPGLENAPAILERLELKKAQERYKEAYLSFDEGLILFDFFVYRRYPEDLTELIKKRNFTSEIFVYFFLKRTQKFLNLPTHFKEYFGKLFELEYNSGQENAFATA